MLLEHGRARVKSDAALRIFELLGFPWAIISAGRVVPRFARDGFYDCVARNRLRWFDSREICFLPSTADREHFIA